MNIKNFWKEINLKDTSEKNKNLNFEKIITYKNNSKPLIEIKNLGITYKSKSKNKIKVFENVNFNIYENEIIALIGPNGAGKTTLVEIISNIKKQTTGEVIFNYKTSEFQDRIGVQFQDLSFPKGLTVKDFIDFQIMLCKNNINKEFLSKMLEVFQLSKLLKYKVSKLSGGQQQRLNVLIAMMSKPKVLFLDEFTTGLDIAIKNEIKNFILDYAKENSITIILISHDIDIIDQMANRFILINNHQILVDASKKDILTKYKSVSDFLFHYIK